MKRRLPNPMATVVLPHGALFRMGAEGKIRQKILLQCASVRAGAQPSNWTRVRFGDVVQNVNETVDPVASGLERFIGLEHLEPGSLHVAAWGSVADGTTFTRRCRPGQVLFDKAYSYIKQYY